MALDFGPGCIQHHSSGVIGSEDCLFLNIWTSFLSSNPTHSQELRPVMFYIHGSGFVSGSGCDPTFDGGNLASRGHIVMVTLNYRLRSLGFLALSDGITNGNFGLADQVTALDWVREHIRAFGGDPDRITISGQSAGAASVRALLGSPMAEGKFAAAIMMSGLGGTGKHASYARYNGIAEEAEMSGNFVLEETGCASNAIPAQCLQSLDAYSLAKMSSPARHLVVDGTYITSNELDLSGPGSAASVAILMGIMRDDGAAMTKYPDVQDYATPSTCPFPDSMQHDEMNSLNATLAAFNFTAKAATDTSFRCPGHTTALLTLANGVWEQGKVFHYEFNRSYQLREYNPNAPVCNAPITPSHPHGEPNQEYFKCHSGELLYVFGNLVRSGYPLRDGYDLPFSRYVVDSWTAFVRRGDPNPEIGYLWDKGHGEEVGSMGAGGSWEPVELEKLMFKSLQRDGGMVEFEKEGWC